MEDETERQGGFDGEIGILELPAPPADASRCPRGDRVGREPEGDVASPHEGSVVLGPVPDAILCRVLRMHSRLHIEIMTRLRSRWSTCRPLLAHRAESAHQRQVLTPTLAPGDIVIMDNLSCHKSPAVRRAIEAVGAQLWFLPKYSPDFNPIALAFAKLKAILRKARCRTREVLWNTIGAAVPGYDPAECRNYFRHCGYSVATTS